MKDSPNPIMDDTTIKRLNLINRQFYQITAHEFDATRQCSWTGWEQLLRYLNAPLRVLDIGCGNGRFGVFLAEHFSNGLTYIGIDNNEELLSAARSALQGITHELINEDLLTTALPPKAYDLVALMGVLHHIPGDSQRQSLIQRLSESVAPRGLLVFTAWRFYDFERFRQRIIPWPEDLMREPGDYLLDWRRGEPAVRYCHYISDAEQQRLISASTLVPVEAYRADGKTANMNEYVVLRRDSR